MLPLIILLYINLLKNNGQWTGWYEQFMFFFYFLLFLFANRRIFYRSFYFQNLKHSTIGLGKHFSPEYECSLHQEQSLKSSWMIGEDLRRNTLAWYTCPDRCINVWLRPEDHQLLFENFPRYLYVPRTVSPRDQPQGHKCTQGWQPQGHKCTQGWQPQGHKCTQGWQPQDDLDS